MYNRKLVFFSACLGMLVFGIVLTTLGSILPSVIQKFAISKGQAGSLMSLLSVGIILGSLVFGPVADRFGYKSLLLICSVLILIGLEGIAFASSFYILRIAVFLVGFGGGVINGGTNALVADISEQEKGANLSFLGVFFGIGAVGIPFLLGISLDSISYESFLAITGLVVLIPILFFLSISFPAAKQAQGFPIKEGFKLLKNFSLLFLGILLFFESGLEITVGSWSSTFMKEELLTATDEAVFFLSFYWFGMILARLTLGALLRRIDPAKILISCLLIALCGSVLMITSNTIYITVSGLILIGIGFAAGFPVILGIIGDLFKQLSGTAFSIAFVIALIGGTILPLITGVLGDLYGLRLSFLLIPLSITLMIIIFVVYRNKLS